MLNGISPLNVADDAIRSAMSARAASMNILITGGTGYIGYIGSHACVALAQAGFFSLAPLAGRGPG